MKINVPQHVEGFLSNLKEVERLIEIHGQIVGTHRGYKPKVEVLNKSGIVLLVACWESFVEDLASSAFEYILNNAKNYTVFPKNVLVHASNALRNSQDERLVWQLAGDGWISVIKRHKERTFEKYLYRFSNPSSSNIDNLFNDLLGVKSISSHWHWPGMSKDTAKKNLGQLIDLRGSIAHRVATSAKIYKSSVLYYINFINRLAVKTHNIMTNHIKTLIGKTPWISYAYVP